MVEWIPPLKRIYDEFSERLKFLFNFFEKKIREHQQEMELDEANSDQQPKDYVVLREMRRRELNGEECHYFR